MKSDCIVVWVRSRNQWAIKIWSDIEKEWIVDSYYNVKDVDSKTELGWIPESLLIRLISISDRYNIYFM